MKPDQIHVRRSKAGNYAVYRGEDQLTAWKPTKQEALRKWGDDEREAAEASRAERLANRKEAA